MPSATINRGAVLYTILLQPTLTPTAVAATTSAEQTFTIPGLLVGDQVSDVSLLGAWSGQATICNFRVTGVNTLGVSFNNPTTTSVTPPSGVYYIEINRPENPNNIPTTAV